MESFLLFLFLALFISLGEACISLGCLGIGCLPPPPCLFGTCLRAPVLPMGPCPCNMGFQCINGGCIMARAKGAKTYKDSDVKLETNQIQKIEDPNSHFLTCCNLLDVPESCNRICTYQGYTREAVQSSLLPISECPVSALPQIHFCAARGADHVPCCREGQVPRECDVFCDQRPGNVTQLSFSHLQCFEKFDEIKGCFLEHALRDYYEAKMRMMEG